jgi:hypothetical protein
MAARSTQTDRQTDGHASPLWTRCQSCCLERKQQQKCLHTVVAPVDKVAHEQVVRLRAVATNFEELLQVVKLAVNVAACGMGRSKFWFVSLPKFFLSKAEVAMSHVTVIGFLPVCLPYSAWPEAVSVTVPS